MFCDLVGFTTLSESRDHEETRELLTRYFDDARRIIGEARTALEFHHAEDLIAVLPEHLNNVQAACARASEAVSTKYFSHAVEASWFGGML